MRKSLVLATLAVLCCTMNDVLAGVPDPSRSGVAVTGGLACQKRFRADGGLDQMNVLVTLRDAFDTAVGSCSTSVTLKTKVGTLAYCNCCPSKKGGITAPDGTLSIGPWRCIGGRGLLDVCVTAHCQGNIAIGCTQITFTSPDLDADCLDTDVIDLGIWAGGLGTYKVASDYNCDNTVNVIDLGIWAGGLGKSCANCPQCP
jgi:hypothetical protein